jgi:hypothetical protein
MDLRIDDRRCVPGTVLALGLVAAGLPLIV